MLFRSILGVPVVRPRVTETTALGAAYLAGLAVGAWGSPAEIDTQWQMERRFEPERARDEAEVMRMAWKSAVQRSKGWSTQ